MKHAATNLIAILVLFPLVILFAPVTQAKKKPIEEAQETTAKTTSMSIWQARRTIITGLQQHTDERLLAAPSRIKIDAESIEFYAAANPDKYRYAQECLVPCLTSGSPYRAAWSSIGEFSVDPKRWSEGFGLRINGRVPCIDMRGCSRYVNPDNTARIWDLFLWPTKEEAQAFADAMNRLRAYATFEDHRGSEAEWLSFQQQAAAWRALPQKPIIPEEVRRQRLLAENAVQEKQFDVAIEEYEAGLKIDPVWPEGHFNAALLCAEIGYYSEAIHHMRAYLELVPDAQDAQAARDQIVIWEAKLTRS